jgi:hypothetical protein
MFLDKTFSFHTVEDTISPSSQPVHVNSEPMFKISVETISYNDHFASSTDSFETIAHNDHIASSTDSSETISHNDHFTSSIDGSINVQTERLLELNYISTSEFETKESGEDYFSTEKLNMLDYTDGEQDHTISHQDYSGNTLKEIHVVPHASVITNVDYVTNAYSITEESKLINPTSDDILIEPVDYSSTSSEIDGFNWDYILTKKQDYHGDTLNEVASNYVDKGSCTTTSFSERESSSFSMSIISYKGVIFVLF